jgi:putative transposase
VSGRKRHLLVDTQGFVLKVVVSAANVSDPAGGRLVLAALDLFGPTLPRLAHLWADAAYSGAFADDLCAQRGWTVAIVRRTDDQPAHTFAVQPHRWLVERTFAWFGGLRRLAKDYEYQLESSEALIYAGMSHILLRRLRRLRHRVQRASSPAG